MKKLDLKKLAAERNFLHPVARRSVGIKASLYMDDAALFVHPCNEDLLSLKEILKDFGEATGLHTNLQKIEVFPI
jgi:hypothetical protein